MSWEALAIPFLLLVVIGVLATRRNTQAPVLAGRFIVDQGKGFVLRLPLAMLTAAFLATLVPTELVSAGLGPDSGLAGILFASLVGGVLPGGPMVAFPIAIFLWEAGAGIGQITALITSWSVFAVVRMIVFEIPIMGWRFTLIRVLCSLIIPPIAGYMAEGAVLVYGPVR